MVSRSAVERPTGRGEAAREALIAAAERLFVEQGLDNVSHRQISAAAGQGNTAAVNYHFGTTDDLILEIARRHTSRIERIRERMVAELAPDADLRDWIGCLIHPLAHHLDSLGNPTWYARFAAQIVTDPRYRDVVEANAKTSPVLRRTSEGIRSCMAELPDAVWAERSAMGRLIVVHILADREADLAAGRPTARPTWTACADGVVDALVGLWQAPVGRASAR